MAWHSFNEAAANSLRKFCGFLSTTEVYHGFNEAAANSLRKCGWMWYRRWHWGSFNEAAANSLRKYVMGGIFGVTDELQ